MQRRVAVLFVHGMSHTRMVHLSNRPLRWLLRRSLKAALGGEFENFGGSILFRDVNYSKHLAPEQQLLWELAECPRRLPYGIGEGVCAAMPRESV